MQRPPKKTLDLRDRSWRPDLKLLLARRTVLALEIGQDQLTLAKFHRGRRGTLVLEQATAVPFEFQSGTEAVAGERLTEFLRNVRRQPGWAGSAKSIVVCLSPHFALTKTIHTPAVAPAKRGKIVQFEASQAIPFPLEEMCWDWHVMAEASDGLEVGVAAVKAEVIRAILAAVGAAGLEVSWVVPSVLALRAALHARRRESTHPALMVCIGNSTTQLLYLDGIRYATRCLGFGRPRRSSIAPETESLAPLVQRLTSEIGRSLVHFQPPGSATRAPEIFLCGNGPLDPVRTALSEGLAADVNVFDPLGGPVVQEGPRGTADVDQAALGSLVGAVAAVDRSNADWLSLIPSDVQTARTYRRRQPALVLAAGFAVLALVPPVLHLSHERQTLRRELQHCEKEQGRLQAARQRGVAHTERLAAAIHDAELLGRIEKRRTAWPRLLGELETRLNSAGDLWLDHLAMVAAGSSSGTTPEAGAVAPPVIEISGRVIERHHGYDTPSEEKSSIQVKRLLSGLRASPLIAAVQEERFEPAGPGVLRFAMALTLNPSLGL